MDNRILVGVILAAILLVGGYLAYSSAPVVSAQGTSNIKAQPDEVSVHISVETRDLTAQGAKDKNTEISDKVLTELVKLGLERKEIQFSNFNIYPEYDWSGGKQKLKGYVASQQTVVKTSNFDKVPGIVDEAVNAGALVNYINFEISDEKQSEYKNKALESASRDAQQKATATASGLGKKLGRLVSVKSQDFYYPGPVVYYDKVASLESGMTAGRAALNIAPQDIDVSASIVVEYKLGWF
ncbi:MAG: SIMPL domain-containing protein [Nanoarchaeota archaeon]